LSLEVSVERLGQQFLKLDSLTLGQERQDVVLDALNSFFGTVECPESFTRNLDQVPATVSRIASAENELPRFEVIQQQHEIVGIDA
jgi:hypothetical protein